MSLPVFVSTSDAYHHILPVFFYLYGKYWRDPMTLVGYKKPEMELPDYCEWHSLGVQGDKYGYGKDMRTFFEKQDECFVYLMEDTFIREPLNRFRFSVCKHLADNEFTGRVSLTDNSNNQYTVYHDSFGSLLAYKTDPNSDYRVSLQPAIWRRDYLCQHLKDGYSPWMVENDNGKLMTYSETKFDNIKLNYPCLISNEGIRRHDLNKFDFTGMSEEDLQQLKQMGHEHNPWSR